MRLIDAELLKSRLSERIRTKRSTMEILKDIFPIIDNMPSVKSSSDELQEYREIGTAQECQEAMQTARACQAQWLDDINNPLEPLKISSALKSELLKLQFRKAEKPESISPLDYTVIAALKEALEKRAKNNG